MEQFLDLLRRQKITFISLALFAVVIWTFLTALRGKFIEFDDSIYVVNNVHVRSGLTLGNIGWAFRNFEAANWHPLTWLSHMLDCQLYGLKPWGHHLTSVLVHAVNTVLVFLVLRKMTGATWRSLAVAGLFGLHPLRAESVAWISERKDVLGGMFWMLTLWAYAGYAAQTKAHGSKYKVFYGLTLLFFGLGLMSKPMVVTLPCVLLLLDYWPLGRWKEKGLWKLVLEKGPLFLLTAIVSVVTYAAQKGGGMMQALTGVPLGARLENAMISYCRYLGKVFWPVDLCALYPYPDRWPVGMVLLAGLFVLGISFLVTMRPRKRPYLFTGWLWYLGTLVPMIGVVQVGTQSMADRYTYIPVVGILVGMVWWVCEVSKGWRYQIVGLSAVGGVAILGCIGVTRHQIGYWRDGVSLWGRAVAVTDRNYDAHNRLGRALLLLGRQDEASREFQEAVRLKPDFAEAWGNLGQTYDNKGQFDEAIVCYRKAVEIQPTNGWLLNNLGCALFQEGRFDDGFVQLQKVLEIEPDDATCNNNLGYYFTKKGRFIEALVHFQHALRIRPDYAEAHYNLGSLLSQMGRQDEAIAQFQKALQIQPNSPNTHNNLGYAFLKKDQPDEAIPEFENALRLKPDYTEASNNLVIAREIKNSSAKQQITPSKP